jgi:hypothetical protein
MTAGIGNDLAGNNYTYTIEDEYGNRKTVTASDSYELGAAIADGNFREVYEPESRIQRTPDRDEPVEGSGGGGLLEKIGAFFGFVILMAIISMIWPNVGHAFETIFGLGIMAAIAYGLYRVVVGIRRTLG